MTFKMLTHEVAVGEGADGEADRPVCARPPTRRVILVPWMPAPGTASESQSWPNVRYLPMEQMARVGLNLRWA